MTSLTFAKTEKITKECVIINSDYQNTHKFFSQNKERSYLYQTEVKLLVESDQVHYNISSKSQVFELKEKLDLKGENFENCLLRVNDPSFLSQRDQAKVHIDGHYIDGLKVLKNDLKDHIKEKGALILKKKWDAIHAKITKEISKEKQRTVGKEVQSKFEKKLSDIKTILQRWDNSIQNDLEQFSESHFYSCYNRYRESFLLLQEKMKDYSKYYLSNAEFAGFTKKMDSKLGIMKMTCLGSDKEIKESSLATCHLKYRALYMKMRDQINTWTLIFGNHTRDFNKKFMTRVKLKLIDPGCTLN